MALAAASGEQKERMERLESLKTAASSGMHFSESELESAVASIRNAAGELHEALDYAALRAALQASAHRPYKDWDKTAEAAAALGESFLKPGSPEFRRVFRRVFQDGHWAAASEAAAARAADFRPWVVLVTGLNGIRKTTCMYQPWFQEVLHAAIARSSGSAPAQEELPTGQNSFFRQLDHIIATVANEEFSTLYAVSEVDKYSALKDGIFSRYRMLAEMWGILLVNLAKKERMNVMVETSGRDPGSFHYIDHCFPDDSYRKLVIHFEINCLSFAERSVDARMLREMADGQKALAGTWEDLIKVNAGGPYGSKVLKGVQADSDRVWEQSVLGGDLAKSWYKASISISAQEGAEWTACATSSEGDTKAFPIERL